jgi:hypothetical protein
MPFVPPLDLDDQMPDESGMRPPGGLVGLGGGTTGNLGRDELIAELANRGQPIMDEVDGANMLARQRRRGSSIKTSGQSASSTDQADTLPSNRFQRAFNPFPKGRR